MMTELAEAGGNQHITRSVQPNGGPSFQTEFNPVQIGSGRNIEIVFEITLESVKLGRDARIDFPCLDACVVGTFVRHSAGLLPRK